MTDYGLTALGFVDKPLEVIQTEMADALKASPAFGPDTDTTAGSPMGVILGIVAGHARQQWEVQQGVNAAFDPDAADGAGLAALAAFSGTVKRSATKSTVELTLTGTATKTIGVGSIVSVAGNSRFKTLEAGTLAAGTAWVALTAYVVGDIVTNNTRMYVCRTAGTAAGSGGPTTQAANIIDGTVHWRWMGDGAAYVQVAAEAETAGVVVANAHTLTKIETPVTGWSNVTNLLDAEIGLAQEDDAELRLRREEEIRAEGTGPIDAIRAKLLQVANVTQVKTFNNVTDTTNSDGVPAHSFEAVVRNGADQDIFDALWANAPAGIASYGTMVGTSTDAQGDDQTVRFTRPTVLTVYLGVDVAVDPDTFPTDGSAQIKTALEVFGQANLGIGVAVILAKLYPAILGVSGVLDITALRAGYAVSPVGTSNLAVGSRELAEIDTSRIVVTHTP